MSTPLPPSGSQLASVDVGTYELRQALRAVVAHCSCDKNAPDRWLRMHWVIDPLRQMVYCAATNGFTSGLAATSVLDDHLDMDALGRFTTSKGTATEILSLFPSNDDGGDDGITDILRLDVHEEYLVITDVSGLLAGKQARWHLSLEPEDVTDLRDVYRQLLLSVRNRWTQPRHRTLASGKFLALFREASVAYGRPLVLEPACDVTGRFRVLVSCSDSFLGVIAPVIPTDEAIAEMKEARLGWERRLGADLDVEHIPGTDPPPATGDALAGSSEQLAGAR